MPEVIYEEAEVREVSSRDGEARVLLRLFPSTDSARCAGCGRCFRPKGVEAEAEASADAGLASSLKEGDMVRVSVTIPALYAPIFIVFGLPLAGLIVGGVAALLAGAGELTVVACALAGAAAALLVGVRLCRGVLRRAERTFRVVERLE